MNTSNNINYPVNYTTSNTFGPLSGSTSHITYSDSYSTVQYPNNNIIDCGTYKIRIYKKDEILYICKFFTTKNKSSKMYKSKYYPTKLTELYNMFRVYEICKLSYNIYRLLDGYTIYDEIYIKEEILPTTGQVLPPTGQVLPPTGQVLGYSTGVSYSNIYYSHDIETISIEI